MIADKDRSGWFGASDTKLIMGNWNTKTFQKFWLEKEGIRHNHFESIEMMAGTEFEHRILESLEIPNLEMDKQILIPELKLRVNLDGNDDTTDYEVKTYKLAKGFDINKHKDYKMQVNVQMYASHLKGEILAYGLKPSDYSNFFAPIERDHLQVIRIDYDKVFIEKWLKKLKYLAFCLDEGIFPTDEGYRKWQR